jgi:hypothetical protein
MMDVVDKMTDICAFLMIAERFLVFNFFIITYFLIYF